MSEEVAIKSSLQNLELLSLRIVASGEAWP